MYSPADLMIEAVHPTNAGASPGQAEPLLWVREVLGAARLPKTGRQAGLRHDMYWLLSALTTVTPKWLSGTKTDWG